MARQAYAKTVRRRESDEYQPQAAALVMDEPKQPKERARFRSMPEQIAESEVFTRNWYWPQAMRFFPQNADMRCVDYYFPYAEGGALLMDICNDPTRQKLLEKKAEALRSLGHRYLIVKSSMTPQAAKAELMMIGLTK